jgi:maltooligosyltrehalose trehalohydrolase
MSIVAEPVNAEPVNPNRIATAQAAAATHSIVSRRHCGAVSLGDGRVRWRVWAPKLPKLNLVLLDGDDREVIPMTPEADGYYVAEWKGVHEGQKYKFCHDGFECRADPCSLWQPDGVTGPSAVFLPERFPWADQNWRGVPRQDLVIYELHVGTFTAAGTFEAVIPRLEELKELGVTAIEVMPVAQFPGHRNWGYDGVLPYAAQNTYGGPKGLQALVAAAHEKGLAVILDVVYNHLGPEDSYIREFGPYFTDKYKTPWGEALNYDDRGSDAVRRFVLDNARMWLEEFHLDGLRLDAVHAIYDLGATHLLKEIGEVAADVAARTGRLTHIVAESDLNDPRIVNPVDRGGHGLDAQWSDDFHHTIHAFLTGERRGYYTDYGDAAQVAEVLKTPFLGAGQYSRHRGRRHGAEPVGLPGDQFVVCIQNHDQVGNRAVGDRLSTLLAVHSEHGQAKLRLAAALMLLSPHLPMLFMGEEYGETRPFPFFCSFRGEQLIEAVRQGRKREFADFLDGSEEIPDPAGEETYRSAVLSWEWPEGTPQGGIRRLYKDLLAARRRLPALRDFERRDVRFTPAADGGGGVIALVRGGTAAGPGTVVAYFNLSDCPQPVPSADGAAGPFFSSESTAYGGSRATLDDVHTLLPYECAAWER